MIRKHLQAAKHDMNEVYKQLEFERLDSRLEEAELASRTNKTGKIWKIVTTITNRKLSPTGKLKRKSADEHKTQWFNHFKSLLGSADVSGSIGET